ncbi:hypothetical protein GCM10010308_61880 [Streptomyces vinaceusdrappus]|nr:hypothetical protein GCM10010301_26350 [Streptomyces plicatus]GHC35167.1 hypothetical protein GCM10010308_61880 [Streptomyces vinaceusdrappus]
MDGTSISFFNVTLRCDARVRGPRRLCGSEPNRLRAIGQPIAHPLDRTESKLFPNGTKTFPKTRSESRVDPGREKPAPVRTGEHAPGRESRGPPPLT